MEVKGRQITWDNFKEIFLENYFQIDVRNKKEMKFLELKQGNMVVADYTLKFEELSRYHPHFNGEARERSKSMKFIYGMCLEIKQAINYQEIWHFSILWIDAGFMMRIVGKELHIIRMWTQWRMMWGSKPYSALINQPNICFSSWKTTNS